jgi:hypothetical protein
MWMNYRGLLIVVLALLLPAAPAAACPGPDATLLNWYDVNLRVDPGPLPAGVSVAPVQNQYVKVSNRGAAPLYVIAPSGQVDPDQPLEMPPGWAATHKLEGGALFTWGHGRWVRAGSITFVALELNSAAISPTLTINLPVGEGRPAGPAPADPTARLILLYDGEQLDVPIVLDYRLDSRYDPDAYQKMSGPCGHSGELFISLLINLGVCLGVLAVAAIVVWIVRLKPPASRPR